MRYRKSGSATLPNPIFYLLLHFPCLSKKILHRSVLIIPQTLHGAVRELVGTEQRHNHPPKTSKIVRPTAIGRQTTTIFCTVQASLFKGPLDNLPCVRQGISPLFQRIRPERDLHPHERTFQHLHTSRPKFEYLTIVQIILQPFVRRFFPVWGCPMRHPRIIAGAS